MTIEYCLHSTSLTSTCEEEALREQMQSEGKRGGIVSLRDLLSLAGFGNKFTIFHDIAKAQLSLIPKPKHSGFRWRNEVVF